MLEEGKFGKALATGALAAGMMTGQGLQSQPVDQTQPKTQITQQVQSFIPLSQSSEFVNHIKRVENSVMSGWDKQSQKWYPHKSFEGGTPTIAYGHKLTKEDISSGRFNNGITMKQAEQLLMDDIVKHIERAKSKIKSLGVDYNKLSLPQRFLIVDFEYTGVLNKFPKFIKALLANNKEEMLNQYKRFSNGRPLKDRNNTTREFILKNF